MLWTRPTNAAKGMHHHLVMNQVVSRLMHAKQQFAFSNGRCNFKSFLFRCSPLTCFVSFPSCRQFAAAAAQQEARASAALLAAQPLSPEHQQPVMPPAPRDVQVQSTCDLPSAELTAELSFANQAGGSGTQTAQVAGMCQSPPTSFPAGTVTAAADPSGMSKHALCQMSQAVQALACSTAALLQAQLQGAGGTRELVQEVAIPTIVQHQESPVGFLHPAREDDRLVRSMQMATAPLAQQLWLPTSNTTDAPQAHAMQANRKGDGSLGRQAIAGVSSSCAATGGQQAVTDEVGKERMQQSQQRGRAAGGPSQGGSEWQQARGRLQALYETLKPAKL